MSEVEISGAARVAIDIGSGSRVRIVAGDIRDNPGSAVAVRTGATAAISHSVFARNATAAGAQKTVDRRSAGRCGVRRHRVRWRKRQRLHRLERRTRRVRSRQLVRRDADSRRGASGAARSRRPPCQSPRRSPPIPPPIDDDHCLPSCRPLRDPRADRARRHGRRVPGHRHRDEPARGPQAGDDRSRSGRPGGARSRALGRQAPGGILPREPLRAGRLRVRHPRAVLLHRHGEPGRTEPLRGDRRGTDAGRPRRARGDAAVRVPAGRGGLRAHARRPHLQSPAARRPQAPEHPRARRRRDQGVRLRHRQGAVAQPQGHAQRLRQHRLPLARASRVGRDRRPGRALGGRGPPLRDGQRRSALPCGGHPAAGTTHSRPRAAGVARWRLPRRTTGDRRQAPRAGRGRPLQQRHRYSRRFAACRLGHADPGRARGLARSPARRARDAADAPDNPGRTTTKSRAGPCAILATRAPRRRHSRWPLRASRQRPRLSRFPHNEDADYGGSFARC